MTALAQHRETEHPETDHPVTEHRETPARETMARQAKHRPARALRLAGWLLLAVAALATWPVTIVTGAGCAMAWLRGWPAARLGRQAGWALPMSAVWIAAESARGWRAMTLDPVRDGDSGWPHLTAAALVRTFLLVAPVTIPAGLALAALLWAWRIYPTATRTGGAATFVLGPGAPR